MNNRRKFLQQTTFITLGGLILPRCASSPKLSRNATGATPGTLSFDISLAEFSFAGELMSGKMTNLEFPARAKNEFGISVLEFVSGFFNNKHTDQAYLNDLKKRCDDLGMKNHLIMVDGENIADLDAAKRKKAVEAHHAWVDA